MLDSILPDIPPSRFDPVPLSKMGERVRAWFNSRAVTRVPALENICPDCRFSDTRSYRRLKNRTTMAWEAKTLVTCSVDVSDHPVRTTVDSTCTAFQAKTR